MEQKIAEIGTQAARLVERFVREEHAEVRRLAEAVGNLFANGGQLIVAGCGSMQPLVQLVSRHFTFRLGFERPVLPAVALGSDPLLAAAMCSGGDAGQHLVRHYRSLNNSQHLLLLFSDAQETGELRALRDEAIDNGQPVALISAAGADDPLRREGVEPCINLAATSPARQLEVALLAGNLLCELIEAELFGV